MSWLSYREFTNLRPGTSALIARFSITIFLNVLFGLIFLGAGNKSNADYASFSAHVRYMMYCVYNI